MPMQGGGVTSHEGVKVYIDLIVKDFHSIESDYPQSAELFSTFAKHSQGESNFGYAELDKDHRLRNALKETKDGNKFYEKLYQKLPVITVSNKILGNVENINNVQIFKLSDFEKDTFKFLNKILKATHIKEEKEKDNFLNGIERLNKILSIKPGIFGISIDINQIINDWIQEKRSNRQIERY